MADDSSDFQMKSYYVSTWKITGMSKQSKVYQTTEHFYSSVHLRLYFYLPGYKKKSLTPENHPF